MREDYVLVAAMNELGIHGSGSARYALDHHGATFNQGFGPSGTSFAIPTCKKPVGRPGWELPFETIRFYVDCFILYAQRHPELQFKVTRIGCGYVGLTNEDMAPLFAQAPDNCFYDDTWKPWLEGKNFWGTF